MTYARHRKIWFINRIFISKKWTTFIQFINSKWNSRLLGRSQKPPCVLEFPYGYVRGKSSFRDSAPWVLLCTVCLRGFVVRIPILCWRYSQTCVSLWSQRTAAAGQERARCALTLPPARQGEVCIFFCISPVAPTNRQGGGVTFDGGRRYCYFTIIWLLYNWRRYF